MNIPTKSRVIHLPYLRRYTVEYKTRWWPIWREWCKYSYDDPEWSTSNHSRSRMEELARQRAKDILTIEVLK